MEVVKKLIDKTISTVAKKTGKAEDELKDKLLYDPEVFVNKYENHMTKKQSQFFKGQVAYNELFGRPRYFGENDTDLDLMTINQVFANVWSRETLPMDIRSMINVALLAAFGHERELKSHIKGAANQGVDEKMIIEIMIHVAHYAGWPAGHNGKRIAKNVFKEINLYKNESASEKRVVVCDFDATITSEETFVGLLYRMLPEAEVSETLWKIHNGILSLSEGVTSLIELIDSNKMEDIINYAEEKKSKIRFGFKKFLEFVEEKKAKFIIVSGGLKIVIENIMKSVFNDDCAGSLPECIDIHAIEIDSDKKKGKMKIINDGIGDKEEAVSKIKIINRTDYNDLIYIGDSKTDEKAAWHLITKNQADLKKGSKKNKRTHVIFARDSLAEKLKEGTFVRWNDFVDIQNCLEKRWNTRQ